MDNRCTICTHASLAEIDPALMDGLPLRPLAAQFGLFASALSRHLKHLRQAPGRSPARDLEKPPAHHERAVLA